MGATVAIGIMFSGILSIACGEVLKMLRELTLNSRQDATKGDSYWAVGFVASSTIIGGVITILIGVATLVGL